MLLCSWFTLTWYPGVVGSTDDPWQLVTVGDRLPGDGSVLEMVARQSKQEARFALGEQPEQYPRGNRTQSLAISKAVVSVDVRDAAELIAAHQLSLPEQKGWLRLQISGKTTEYSIDQVLFTALPAWYDARRKLVILSWEFPGGKMAVYAGDPPSGGYTPGEVIAGPSSTDRGAILRGPGRDLTPE